MRLKMKKQNVVLKTKGKYLTEDIEIIVDNSVINNENNTLKNVLDVTKSCKDLFNNNTEITANDAARLIQYSDTENVENMSYMFRKTKLTSLPLLDTSKVTDMSYFCSDNNVLTTFPQYDTSNVVNMSHLCDGCSNLIEFPEINTSNVENMTMTFSSCSKLEKLPPLNTNKVTDFCMWFQVASNISKIDISHYNISSTLNCTSFITYANKLKVLIIRSFGENYVLNSNSFSGCKLLNHTIDKQYNPNNINDGYIYVPRDMINVLSQETNWSAMYFRALEDYTLDGTCWGEFDDAKAGLI